MFINTLQKTLIICLYSFHSIALSAQSDNNNTDQNIELKPAITEKDIASYFPEKYPTKRWENKAVSPDFYNTPYDISLFSAKNGEDSARLWSQTKSMFAYGFGVIGIIALLPEDVSNWDKEQGLFSKWSDNVKEGPVWDRDNGPLNLIGHPYFGGVYYQAARKSGYRQWDAFIYSTLMSSFYWEYGIEAFAEVPSIQDLVITPVLGWVYGEWAFTTEMKIRQNNDEIFGSSFLGSSALIFLDPVDSLSVGINQLFGKEIIKAGTSYVSVKEVPIDNDGNTENQYQLNVNFQLGDGRNYPSTKSHPPRSIKDPVDTGIIGVSYGVGDLSLDKNWQLSDDLVTEYSLGLYFSKSFSARLSYAKTKVTSLSTLSEEEIAYENYSLDGQYYFNSAHSLRPYISSGFGEMMWKKSDDLKTFQINIGPGIHYKISDNFAIQLDWRHYYSTNTKTSENTVSSRLIYFFGNGEG